MQHQIEASQLAASKRQAEAADPAEQRAKRAATEQARRDRGDMGEDEWQAFTAWREATNVELPSRDDVSDWHACSEYDEWRMEQLADDWQADDAAYEAYRARD